MREYRMTDDQLAKLQEACQPVPCMKIGTALPRTPQETANAAWESLGEELGFEYLTVRPVPGKDTASFMAEPRATAE